MSAIHLSPRLYTSLQEFVHQGHRGTFDLLKKLLGIRPGEAVVEVGCGTGILARHFVAQNYDYWGIDLDPERIATAQRETPKANFLVHDAVSIERAPLPPFRHVFIHGLLHHLDDSQCRKIINHLMSLEPRIVLAVIEPFSPKPWSSNPLGMLFARMDEGKYV